LYKTAAVSEVTDYWGSDPGAWVTAPYSKATALLEKQEIAEIGQLLLGLRAAAVALGFSSKLRSAEPLLLFSSAFFMVSCSLSGQENPVLY